MCAAVLSGLEGVTGCDNLFDISMYVPSIFSTFSSPTVFFSSNFNFVISTILFDMIFLSKYFWLKMFLLPSPDSISSFFPFSISAFFASFPTFSASSSFSFSRSFPFSTISSTAENEKNSFSFFL